MNPVQETVLLYYPKEAQIPAEDQIHLRSARYQFRILDAASTAQKIGYLTGRTGFEKALPMSLFQKFHNLCW